MRVLPSTRWSRAAPAALAASLLLLPPPALLSPVFAQPAPSRANGAAGAARPPQRSQAPVTLNFVNADVEAVTRAIGAMLDRQILVDPRVKGTVTVYSEQAVSVREAYFTYLAALRGLGFAVVESGGFLKVVPEADAKLQAGTVSIGASGQRGDQVMTQIFRLNYENPNNLVAVLRPLISANNTINVNPANSSLVITDYADNLQRLAKIIAALDQPATTDIEVIPVKAAAASDLAPIVQRLADSSGASAGAPGAPAGVMGGSVSVLPDARSNSLIVRASNAARLAYVRSIVEKLDQPTQGSGPAGNIWVVYLKNADAAKLATVLRAAFGGGAGGGSSGGGGGGGSSGSSPFGGGGAGAGGASGASQGIGGTGASSGQSAAAATPVQASAGPSTGGNIQADPSTNSLIITAPEPLYRQMRGVIDQLDSRRVQVAIESMIVEVSGNNAADFGFQWQGLLGRNGDKYGLAGGTNFGTTGNLISLTTAGATGGTGGTGTATAGAGISLGEGLNVALIRDFGGTYGLAAIARLLQSQTNTNIVSTPNLITLDNEEAKIIVGSNVPFITGQFTNTGTSTTSPFQTIERKDVGITLRIKPQVGEGGTIRMQIFQESSSLSGTVAPGTSNAGPSTDKRSIESTVVVDDGAILVLGGLIEDKFTNNNSKVPLLGDIPYVGGLFRSESRTKTRTNLMVFLRPVVMRDADTTLKYSMDRYDLIRAQQKDSQPKPNIMLPLTDSPVLPPLRAVDETLQPLAVPPSAPGGALPPRAPPAPDPAASAPAH